VTSEMKAVFRFRCDWACPWMRLCHAGERI